MWHIYICHIMTLIILNINTKFTDNLRIPIYIITGQIIGKKKYIYIYFFFLGIINVLTTTPLWVVNTRLKMKGIQVTPERNNNEYTTLYGKYILYENIRIRI